MWSGWTAAPPLPNAPPPTAAPLPTTPAAVPTATAAPQQYTAAQFAAMTPEQQYALQAHWQQWQKYQEEYAKWHAQYGEQYNREIAAAAASGAVAAAAPTVAAAVYPPAYTQPQPPLPPPDNKTPTAQQAPQVTAVTVQMPTQAPVVLPTPPVAISGQPQLYTQPPLPATMPVTHPFQQQPPPTNFGQPPPNFNPSAVYPSVPSQYNQSYSNDPNKNAQHVSNTNFPPNVSNPYDNIRNNPPPNSSYGGVPNQFQNQQNNFGPPYNQQNRNNQDQDDNARNCGDKDNMKNRNVNSNNENFRNNRNFETDNNNRWGNRNNDRYSGGNNESDNNNRWGNRNEDRFGNPNNMGQNEPWQRGDQRGGGGGNSSQGNNWVCEDDSNSTDFNQASGNNRFGPNQSSFGPGNNRGGGPNPGNINSNWNDRRDSGNFNRGGPNQGNMNNSFNDNRNSGNFNRSGPDFGPNRGGPDFGPNRGGPDFGPNRSGPDYGPNRGGPDFGPNRSGPDFGPNRSGPGFGTNRGGADFGLNRGGPDFGPNHGGNQNFGNNFGPNHGANQGNWENRGKSDGIGGPNQTPQRNRAPELDEEGFDRLFRQWEQQFEDWKKANVNNPDREMYERYEQEFEKQRRRLIERRDQMRRRKMEQMGEQGTPSSTHSNIQPHVPDENKLPITNETPVKRDDDTAVEPDTAPDRPEQNLESDKDANIIKDSNMFEERHENESSKEPRKRKSRFGSPVENKISKPQEEQTLNTEIIELDDDDDDVAGDHNKDVDPNDDSNHNDSVEEESSTAPISSFFKKTDGIPGLDLVDDDSSSNKNNRGAEISKHGSVKKAETTNSPAKKIPSLFDIVIKKPDEDDAGPSKQRLPQYDDGKAKIVSNVEIAMTTALPDIANSLKDPEFMKKITEALAKAQGKEKADPNVQPPPQFLQQLPNLVQQIKGGQPSASDNNLKLSFAEWQSRRGNSSMSFSDWQSQRASGSDSNIVDDIKKLDSNNDSSDRLGPDGGPNDMNRHFNDSNFIGNSEPNSGRFGPNDTPMGGGRFGNNDGPMGGGRFGNNDGPMGGGCFGSNDGPTGGRFGNNNMGGQFGNNDGPMGGRFGPNDGPMGGRFGPNDGPLGGPFGPNDGPMGGRFNNNNNNNGPMGGRFGNNNMGGQFGNNDGPMGGRFGNQDGPMGNRFGNYDGPMGNRFGNNNGPVGGRFGNNNMGGQFGNNDGPMGGRFGNQNGPMGNRFGNNEGPMSGRYNNNNNNGPMGDRFGNSGGPMGGRFDNNNDGPMGGRFGNDGPNAGRRFGSNDGPNFGGRNTGRDNRNNRGSRFGSEDKGNSNNDPTTDDDTNKSVKTGDDNADQSKGNKSNNPFRRSGGPQVPVFDESNQKKNSNAPSSAGPAARNVTGIEDDFYRPVKVIDYQNTSIAAKVIDYGHKPSAATPPIIATVVNDIANDFRPVKTFDYGHSNNANVVNQPTTVAPQRQQNQPNLLHLSKSQRRRQKKKNKNNMSIGNIQGNNTNVQQQTNAAKNKNETSTSTTVTDAVQQQQPNPNNKNEQKFPDNPTDQLQVVDLEEISDTEDDTTATDQMRDDDNESPLPPPPPIFSLNEKYIPAEIYKRNDGNGAIFPSTAAANQNINITTAKHLQMSVPSIENQNTILIDEILLQPGRQSRPKKICIILRGPPCSGKSYMARLIKEKECEMGGTNSRILSIDDYFLVENDYEEKCPKTGKMIPKKEILYEYDKEMEATYTQYLIKLFKKTIADGLYDFIIIDCNNNSLRTLNDFYNHAKDNGIMPYIVDLKCDLETCLSRNIHERTEKDIKEVLRTWNPTPFHYIKLDCSTLLENLVEMEDAENMITEVISDDEELNQDDNENVESTIENQTAAEETAEGTAAEEGDSNDAVEDEAQNCAFLKSKWENDTENLARLDGTSKLKDKRKAATMEDYLQIDDWEPPKTSKDGKKRVRWADIEEKRAQEKMRAIGFVVGQTDWKRMMDPNAGNRALNRTKFIERNNRRGNFKRF